MLNRKDYEEAVRNPGVRREFVMAIDLEEAGPYISRVDYKEKGIGIFICPRMGTRVPSNVLILGLKGQKSKVHVGPEAFSGEFFRCLGDFLSVLIDHEGMHARMIFNNPKEYKFSLLNFIMDVSSKERSDIFHLRRTEIEQKCIYNQIENFERRDCSRS